MKAVEPLWRPSRARIADAGITRYQQWLEEARGLSFASYDELWEWSVTEIEAFWQSIWDYCRVISHSPYEQVLVERTMPGARWFEGATLNYAEHSLARAHIAVAADQPAIIFQSELVDRAEVSWQTLNEQVGSIAATLKSLGLKQGDRAVAYMPNVPETVAAMLAVTSQGGIWSCTAPDMGAVGVLDRFRQIEPRILFAIDGYRYGGRDYDRRDIVKQLVRQLPSVESVIFVPYLDTAAELELTFPDEPERQVNVITFREATSQPQQVDFAAVPFSHPLWIVYSSGTTGMPKPIVHGHGGVVIQNLKAGLLHGDSRPGDRAFWFTSTNWIMWNSVVNGLMNGVTIMLFDGNPGYPDCTTLWRFAERERVNAFGTSPAFIALCMKAGIKPVEQFNLGSLRSIGCTGSPLSEEGYRWVYSHVKTDVRLGCISGGTDPGACFLTTCSILPVYAGEMQCRELGVATHAFDDEGNSIIDEVGELVVTEPMPSMPLFFWGDTDGSRYYESYFETYAATRPGVWCHGDWLRLIPREESITGIIYGRSDSTINRHGIRMGTSEIYRVIEEYDDVLDSLVIDLEYLERPSYMALFVVMRTPGVTDVVLTGPAPSGSVAGAASLGDATPEQTGVPLVLRNELLNAIRTKLSARHVPDEVFAIPAVPRTLSGKKLEIPVKKILLGKDAGKSVNRDSMANPESIDWFVDFATARG
ncbi:MAG: acetoacetate--CoA ligase [Pseudohongiella sp.]